MTINVATLPTQQIEDIEDDAQRLLEAYFNKLGTQVLIPIPVDEIIEHHLGFSLSFCDLGSLFGMPSTDVLGAMLIDSREVLINKRLDPDEHPEMEGRFHFTCGHEVGHWCEHRSYLIRAGFQICRSSQAKAWIERQIERQADHFSACLLMPREHVLAAWSNHFGSSKPFVFADVADHSDQDWTRRNKYRASWPREPQKHHERAFGTISKKFAPMFRVSPLAMRIRLENLGLLRIDHPPDPRHLTPFGRSEAYSCRR